MLENYFPILLFIFVGLAVGVANTTSRVQVVMDMDGWGPPHIKRASYKSYVYREPVQFTGFKLFYHNDTKAGHPLMKPADVLALMPKPVYIQYQ